MCFAWISEQTAITSLYSLNLSVFETEAECLLRGTSWVFKSDRYSFVIKGLKVSRNERLHIPLRKDRGSQIELYCSTSFLLTLITTNKIYNRHSCIYHRRLGNHKAMTKPSNTAMICIVCIIATSVDTPLWQIQRNVCCNGNTNESLHYNSVYSKYLKLTLKLFTCLTAFLWFQLMVF